MEQAVFARSPSIALISRLGVAMHDAAPRMADGDAPDFFGGGAGLTMLQTILDHVHIGVTVVGPRFRLLFANRAALRECAHHPVLRIDRDRLVVSESRHEGDLSRALTAARSGRWSLVQLVHGDERTMLAVLPLRPNAVCADAPALVVFGPRAHGKRLAIQFYAQAHGLSPAETAVLRALGEGLSPKEIADRNDVAVSTVRTQLSSIRVKTGTRSITELVLTLGQLPPIMPAALSAL